MTSDPTYFDYTFVLLSSVRSFNLLRIQNIYIVQNITKYIELKDTRLQITRILTTHMDPEILSAQIEIF